MFFTRPLVFGSLLLFAAAGFCQTSNTVIGAGYSLPFPINAAPGQILNLFVQGVGATLTERVAATSLPLPTVLAGISVQLEQAYTPQSVAVPLLAVRPVSTCLNGALASAACGRYTVVTVEMPFELVPYRPCGPCDPPPLPNPQLVVSENGLAGGAIDLNPVADQVHLANLCDADSSAPPGCASIPAITHANGSLVLASSPAKAGEEIVIWALGLGSTKPAVATGQATPSPAPIPQTLQEVNYDYEPNAGPSRGWPAYLTVCSTTVTCPNTPVFSGLTPGYVGLYQVNFVIPAPPPGTPACGTPIASNLTLTLVGSTSFDGAGICVETSASGTASASAAPAPLSVSSSSTIPLNHPARPSFFRLTDA